MFEFLRIVIELAMVVLVVYIGFLFYSIEISSRRRSEKVEQKIENLNVDSKKLPRNNPNDFYGLHKLRNDEKGFFEDVEKKEKILENGGQIGVNAAEALFLMRNNRHSDMVISEEGRLIIQKKIMDFQAPIKDGESPRIIAEKLPDYVDRIEELPDGGFRKWFTEAHAAACGVKSIRFDAYGRSRGDPEMDIDNEKNKNKNKEKRIDYAEPNAAQALLADISKKMSRQNEMLADVLVDRKLAETEQKQKQQKFNPKQKQLTPVALSEIDDEKVVVEEYKDDIQKLEVLCPPPVFLELLSGDLQNNLIENNISKTETETQTIILEDHSASIKIEYGDFARFVAVQAADEFFVEMVLKNVFSEKGKGNIFIDFENSIVLVEKNYFAKTSRELLEDDDHDKFDRDFFSKGAIGIFDGVKIAELVGSMNFKNYFIGTGKENSKVVYNHLLESTDVEGVCFSGWFLKIAIDNHFASDFISENMRGANVNIIASEKTDVDKISKQYKNVKLFY